MARTIWKGSLSFGLVNVPVGLYPATQDKAIHFNQLEAGTSDRIRYKKVNERTGQEVESGSIVKGFDLGGGEYVVLTDEELAAAEPQRSRLVEITDFVDLDDIDPVYYRSSYYLAPEGEAAGKAYALLREVMQESKKVAIGTLVMRNKEYPVAIRPNDEVLTLETMYFADEIRSPAAELPALPDASELSDREVSMAKLLLESMESEWDPDRYHDTHRQKVEDLVEAKRQGNEIVLGSTEPPVAKVADLMEVLAASIESAKSERSGSSDAAEGETRPRRRPTGTEGSTPARKSPAKAKASAAGKGVAKRSTTARKSRANAPTSITEKADAKPAGGRKAS
jgi:DNA end-binding protein Ku